MLTAIVYIDSFNLFAFVINIKNIFFLLFMHFFWSLFSCYSVVYSVIFFVLLLIGNIFSYF